MAKPSAIEVVEEPVGDMVMFDPGELMPDMPEQQSQRPLRLGLLQGMSKEMNLPGARLGMWAVRSNDQVTPPDLVEKLRVYLIAQVGAGSGDFYKGPRTMWGFTSDGKKDMDAGLFCKSYDGITPAAHDADPYVGRVYTDSRTSKTGEVQPEYTIPSVCAGCPFSEWTPIFEMKGGQVVRDAEGNPVKKMVDGKQVTGAPPKCQPSPKFFVWLLDYNQLGVIETAAPNVRRVMLGAPRKKIPGIAAFFAQTGTDPITKSVKYANLVNDQLFPVVMGGAADGTVYVPTLRLGDTPLTADEFAAIRAVKAAYAEARARFEDQDYADPAEEVEERTEPFDSTMTTSQAADKLGSGKRANGKTRRMASTEDPFADA